MKNAPQILIVDDNVTNLQVLGSILKENKYNVLIAKNGTMAINTTKQYLPDLILLDIMMPEMNGYEVAERLKSNPETAMIPIIFISAKNDEDSIVEGFNVGGQDYISKPFIPRELIARVQTHLSIRKNEKNLEYIINAKNNFFQSVTKTLKDPLSQLASFSQMLPSKLEAEDYQKAGEYAKLISDTAIDQFKVFENLLEWAKIQTGHYSPFLEDVDIAQVIESAVGLQQSLITQKSLQLTTNFDTGIAFADADLIGTVLRNLINNACKFSLDEGEVTINVFEKDDSVFIEVHNKTGFLSSDDAQTLLVEGANLSDVNPDHEEKGAGLGLPICRELAKINSGSIMVEGLENEGAKFTLKLQTGF